MKRAPLDLLVAIGIAAAAPAWAVSLPAAGPAQSLPEGPMSHDSLTTVDSWSAGSSSLVPLMAADMQANQTSNVDAPEVGGGGETGKPLDDIAFVRKATESGRTEVASANEALPQLQRPELRRIAEMLVSDHSGANARLADIADSKGWPVPSAKAAPPPPSGTASSDFDAKWTAEMIAGHERSVALYRAQAQNGEDKDLRKYARETLPTIERHLADLRRLQK
jgi:predicted outer membrane protein